jgi:PIN domain nuclease of toxin-antitoxin system
MSAYLLDTMTVLWMAFEPERISKRAAATLLDDSSPIHCSIFSLWEIGIKMGGRGYREFVLPDDWEIVIPEGLAAQGIGELRILPRHCRRVQELPAHHKDPFDRVLIAQALEEGLEVIGCDGQFDAYGVRRVW